jgi:hypothetical protein
VSFANVVDVEGQEKQNNGHEKTKNQRPCTTQRGSFLSPSVDTEYLHSSTHKKDGRSGNPLKFHAHHGQRRFSLPALFSLRRRRQCHKDGRRNPLPTRYSYEVWSL